MQLTSANSPSHQKKYETPLLVLHVSQYYSIFHSKNIIQLRKEHKLATLSMTSTLLSAREGNAYVLKGKPGR
jgi:hypothetical protein